ncbi:MAG TPA: GGDEF domain-containing protein [Thauera sp.]|uniref:GGDEF domain-containing protein n=1 Tax=Thauera sp. TaxID=1905334 RepID=UPI000FBE950C|nr:GGDEF domain-containing protein [Thauera sp.]RTL21442.1 MAG: GGDEF domain-containing protein [Rhodocyclaceae bacterium]MCB1944818.1 GGDEF domain-containing protein [Thauera sp.]MCP5224632.1 GGDEF domain-containing protein [Thauera sp.]HPE03986.1 GGDEF domain-containing protein [Thauera sp.]HRV78608.1 GGDEF domain-containing protein [Thauera sp.]
MPTLSNPSEIAREALRQLALRRVAPTPDNYRKLYHEIAGTRPDDDALPEAFVRKLARRLPRDNAERQRHGHQLDQALADGRSKAAEAALERYLESLKLGEPQAWNELIGNLLRQWEARQTGWTPARKREALDRVLGAADPAALYTRLQGLLKSWTQAMTDADALAVEVADVADDPAERASAGAGAGIARQAVPARTATTGPAAPPTIDTATVDALRELVTISLGEALPPLLEEHPPLRETAATLCAEAASRSEAAGLREIGTRLRVFARELELAAADEAEIRAGMLELLRMLLRNIDDLVLDDRWLAGQIEMLREIVDSRPDPRKIDDAGRRLKELIYKQGQLKHTLAQSQRHLRDMLAGFVDQLARFSESTGAYHDRIGQCAQRIAQANDITEIGPLLDEVMTETRSIQDEARRSRDELIVARSQAAEAQERIVTLQNELEEASRLMRHDQLTGALNRRGLEEMFQTESARAQRRGTRLAVALLDIDHFKKLNDSLGHKVGDDALVHLAKVVRQHLRPQDVLARYGGEEFVILLPETGDTDAQQALIRLQRELTREFFMADLQKVVITFSAGVTRLAEGESLESALKRADGAMYQAKQAGRNRVMVAPLPDNET